MSNSIEEAEILDNGTVVIRHYFGRKVIISADIMRPIYARAKK